MATKILKYCLFEAGQYGPRTVTMPRSAKIVHVDYQGSLYGHGLMAWCEVVNTEYEHDRTFVLLATGEDVPDNGKYIKTVMFPTNTVWHMYELKG